VGKNGCGKSTLLKILAEVCCPLLQLDSANSSGGGAPSSSKRKLTLNEGVVYNGRVEQAKGLRVSYVEQDPPTPSDITVADALLGIVTTDTTTTEYNKASSNKYQVVQNYRLASEQALSNPDAFARAAANMDEIDGC